MSSSSANQLKQYDVRNVIAANIRLARLHAGLTQSELADAMQITTQQLSKYENAIDRVSACRLFVIAQLTGAPIEQLFSLRDWEHVEPDRSIPPSELLRAITRLPQEQQEALTALAVGIADGATIIASEETACCS